MATPARAPLPSRGSFSLELPYNRRRHDHNQAPRPANHYGIDEVVEDNADAVSSRAPLKSQQLQQQQQPALKPQTAAAQAKPQLPRRFSGVPDPRSPPVVVDSGVVHELIHVNCTPMPGVVARPSDRLVATIFYNGHKLDGGAGGADPPVGLTGPGQAPHEDRRSPDKGQARPARHEDDSVAIGAQTAPTKTTDQRQAVPLNLAPTTEPATFPLELPATDAEPSRDGLYGAYVSPICIAAFLHLMSTFPHRKDRDEDAGAASTYIASGYGSNLNASHRHLDDNAQPRVVEVVLSPAPALALADLRRHEQLYRFEREWGVEVALQYDTLWRRHPRLVVFDMDSTLITQEVIDMLAEAVAPDVAARVAEITHRAMQGELPFDSAFRERVRLLAGLPATLFDDLRSRLNVTNGVPALLRGLRRLGVKTAVLSGGFQPLTGWLAGQLGIDHAHANQVVVDAVDNRLTGEVTGAIVGRERKCALLQQIAKEEGVDLRQVVAVGDGANDLLMLATAGLGVAWHAKPVVQLEADARLNRHSLLDLLYLFGFTSSEIAELSAEEASQTEGSS
ncbi:phosphoserine phosphatase [Niveomyces insectorum RCEF 264]|uniref:phosphoserine phosphatase n=1 Tax=Niveomyces insectorum RCEF 264 TaxID=1081102 RepID=A0A162J1L5_9HYPO|nr:phosphoserine phosphatase [Niveomyces insectorum RCEF 264]